MRKTGSKAKKWAVWVTLGVLLVAVAVYAGWRWQVKHEVRRRIAALRASGLPVNWSELNDYYPAVPDDQNAALVLTQAFALQTTFPDARSNAIESFEIPSRTQKLDAQQRQLLSGYVRLNEAAYLKAREALRLTKSRYPVDLSLGPDAKLDHLRSLKWLAWNIQKRALLDFNDRHYPEGTEAIECMLGLARTVEEEPVLISQLVRVAIIYMSKMTLEYALNNAQLDEAQLSGLEGLLKTADSPDGFARALAADRAMLLPLFDMRKTKMDQVVERMTENSLPTNSPSDSLTLADVTAWLTLSRERECLLYLDCSERGIELMRQPPPQSLEAGRVFAPMISYGETHGFALTCAAFGALDSLTYRQARLAEGVRLSRTALAVERFHLKFGLYPISLRVLVPQYLAEVPTDPFDGQPLKYRRLEDGYVVYSMGPDGHDDGGREAPFGIQGKGRTALDSYDLTFTVQRGLAGK